MVTERDAKDEKVENRNFLFCFHVLCILLCFATLKGSTMRREKKSTITEEFSLFPRNVMSLHVNHIVS